MIERSQMTPYHKKLSEDLKNLDSRSSNGGTGAKDGSSTVLLELIVVLSGDNTTHNNNDILTTKLLELGDNLRNESEMTCSK